MEKATNDVKTDIETSEYKGSPTFTIWEVGDDGVHKKFPVISFGKRKAQAILKHIEEIRKFAES